MKIHKTEQAVKVDLNNFPLEKLDDMNAAACEKLNKLKEEYQEQQRIVSDIQEAYRRKETADYTKYLGQYVIWETDDYVVGGKITYVQSMGPGHDSCHLAGITFMYYRNSGHFSMTAQDEGSCMYPDSIYFYNDELKASGKIVSEDEFVSIVRKYQEEALSAYLDCCKSWSPDKPELVEVAP